MNYIRTLASVASSLLLATAVQAQEFKPYPRANITEAQWNAYFDEVRQKHGDLVQDIEDQQLLVFTDRATNTIYGFTKPGHPAHPAWIARKPEVREDNLFIAQIGYFAGAEPPFGRLFRSYLALNEKLKEDAARTKKQAAKE